MQLKIYIADCCKRAAKSKQFNYACFVIVFLLSLFFCWLLSMAYPEGLVNEETPPFWTLQTNFRWFQPNQLDFFRTIPYGALLGVASGFANPTNVLYWLNALIFSFCSALVFVLGLLLFRSRLLALILAISALFFEIACMHIFYLDLQVYCDPIYSLTIYLATLLALISWLSHRTLIYICACALFGLAAFMKPSGVTLIPLWVLFALFGWLYNPARIKGKYFILAASIILIIAPIGLWSLRNFCLYGIAKPAAISGCTLLQAVLPLLADTDHLFADPVKNTEFIAAVRQCEQFCQMSHDENLSAVERRDRYERYYLYGPAPNNAFLALGKITNPDWQWKTGSHSLTDLRSDHMFKLDEEAGRVALGIIKAHPFLFLKRIRREYIDMYNPTRMPSNPFDTFQAEPDIAYLFWDSKHGPRTLNFSLYPGKGLPIGTGSNEYIAQAFFAICNNPVVKGFLNIYYSCELYISHIIFFVAVLLLLFQQGEMAKSNTRLNLRSINLVLVMLFLTAASNCFVVALWQIAKLRYQLAGDMELHLMFLLALWTLLALIMSKTRHKGLFDCSVKENDS